MDLIYTLHQTNEIANQLVQQYASNAVWVFQAPMGAGKTTLIAAIGKAMGIQEAMSSPTFSIMNEYEVQGKLIYHMDWYRIENEAEARQAGVEAALEEAIGGRDPNVEKLIGVVNSFGGFQRIEDKGDCKLAIGALLVSYLGIIMRKTHPVTRLRVVCEALFSNFIFGVEATSTVLEEVCKKHI